MLAAFAAQSQIVINEIDSDTPGTDDKEFIELKSETPFFPLDGYVVVLFNGSATSSTGNRSYFAVDLDGYATDINGIITIGSSTVSPVPAILISVNVIQNGADAVAIYQANASDFPPNTLATQTNLIDALVYGTSDSDAVDLMALLGETVQIDENMNSQGTTQSIQRMNDGTYVVKAPTPGANNDGSGFIFNGLSINVPQATYDEGEIIPITFTAQTPVASDLNFSFTLNNGNFNATDYTADLNVTIPAGSTSTTVNVQLVDDATDEGDELAVIRFGALPQEYNRINDFVEIRIIDNDWTVSPWGTPLNPTYGVVTPEIPEGYYSSLEGKAGDELRQAIQDIIADPSTIRKHTYGDIEIILKQADQDPQNSNRVWMMYVEQPRAKYKFQSTSSSTGSWNREHIWPQSRGGFADATSSFADGFDIWESTGPNDISAGHSDAHHLRAEDGPENSARNNRDYGTDYNGPTGNAGSWKGDVARALFYMAVRYNGLTLVNGNPPDSTVGQMADLASLLLWNVTDPADDFEMNRNNIVYTWQRNRNPFIDYPLLADYLWGEHAGEPWSFSLGTSDNELHAVRLYPNPVQSSLTVAGIERGQLEIVSLAGNVVANYEISGVSSVSVDLPSGFYLARISADGKSTVKKIVVK